jgi:hypothetical protein
MRPRERHHRFGWYTSYIHEWYCVNITDAMRTIFSLRDNLLKLSFSEFQFEKRRAEIAHRALVYYRTVPVLLHRGGSITVEPGPFAGT